MTIKPLNTPVEEIARGLTETERQFVMTGAWQGASFYAPEVHALNGKELLHIDVMKTSEGNIRHWKARLTPLGQSVRTHLEREGGGNG